MDSSFMDLKDLMLALYEAGAIKFGRFRLKVHETYPEAPLSPFYVNLRTSDNKDGPLTDELVLQIGHHIAQLIDQEYPAAMPSYICGLPRAGEPLAQAIANLRGPRQIRLRKVVHPDGRRQILPPDPTDWPELSGVKLLPLIDDLITRADTKLEGAAAARAMGFLVRHVFVFLDRSNGGAADALSTHNLALRFVLNDRNMFRIYTEARVVTPEHAEECLEYKHNLEIYILDARRSLDGASRDSQA